MIWIQTITHMCLKQKSIGILCRMKWGAICPKCLLKIVRTVPLNVDTECGLLIYRNSVYSPFSSPAIAAFSEASLLIGDDK